MKLAMHDLGISGVDALHFGTGRISMLLAALAITVAVAAGIYVAAAALARTMAATFATRLATSHAQIVSSAPLASPASAGHGGRSVAERNSLGMRSVRWRTDATDVSL